MISIKDLSVSYKKEAKVIDKLNLSLSEGYIHGIVGLNGAGKTTLLNTVYGLKKQKEGSITADGQKINKKYVSYLTTENFFYPNITAREYLLLFKNSDFQTDMYGDLFRLPLDEIINEYSTGMKKKLAIMGILKQNKPIMILDEPFNGLDIETAVIVRSILLKLKEQGKTIIITSHIIATLTNLCDYIHYLEKGKISYSFDKYGFDEFEKKIFSSIEMKNESMINKLFNF